MDLISPSVYSLQGSYHLVMISYDGLMLEGWPLSTARYADVAKNWEVLEPLGRGGRLGDFRRWLHPVPYRSPLDAQLQTLVSKQP